MVQFIRKEFHVQEPDKSRTIRQDVPAERPGFSDTGVLYLIGLPGSGKTALAAKVAESLGVAAHELPLEGAAQALEDILAKGPAVVEVPQKLLTDAGLRARMQATGRVLYLMANVDALARRLTPDPADQKQDEDLKARLVRQLAAYEPWFLQTMHLLVPADGPLDEVLAMTLERMRF